MPCLDLGLVECANGARASAEKDCVLSLADASERSVPMTSAVAMLVAAVANVSSKDEG